ncbi:MAG TPA: hypothetical protein VF529_07940 [Solirubrobacteraceae bacterium]
MGRTEVVRFYGQDLRFTAEVRYLVADQAATVALGAAAKTRGEHLGEDADPIRRNLSLVLDRLSESLAPDDVYRWLVVPHPELAGQRPFLVAARGRTAAILEIIERSFARPSE